MDTTGAKDLGTASVKVPTTPYEDEQEKSLAALMTKLQSEQQPGIEPEPWDGTEDGGLHALAFNIDRLTNRVADLEKRAGIGVPEEPPRLEMNSFGQGFTEPLRPDVEHGLNDSLDYPENAEYSKKHWEHRAIEAEKLLGKAQGQAEHHRRNVERLTAVAQAFISEAGGETASERELYNTDSGSVRHALDAFKQMRVWHDRLRDETQELRTRNTTLQNRLAAFEEWASRKPFGDPREEV